MTAACPVGGLNTPSALVLWRVADQPIEYLAAVNFMENQVAAIRQENGSEMVWLLEHPPVYTAGTSARTEDLLTPDRFPVHATGRGGQYTYHGPGQRVAYVMMDLNRRGPDIRNFVCNLEKWLIDTLAVFDVTGERREGRVGIWVRRSGNGGEDKIAAVGIRVRRWVSYHGVSLNLDPDLSHYEGIVPCGITQHGVTSLAQLGKKITLPQLDAALKKTFEPIFGPVAETENSSAPQP